MVVLVVEDNNKKEEIQILIELIKMNEQNAKSRLSDVSDRLVEYVETTKENFDELKDIVKSVGKRVDSINSEIHDKTIKPLQLMINEHHESIRALKDEQRLCVKKEICEENEKIIKAYFWDITKKIIAFNCLFFVIYTLILYNSNISVNWPILIEIFRFFFGS